MRYPKQPIDKEVLTIDLVLQKGNNVINEALIEVHSSLKLQSIMIHDATSETSVAVSCKLDVWLNWHRH